MNFFTELKRRHVMRVASVYAVTGWLIIQLAQSLEEALKLPEWFDATATTLVLIGFPIAMILAWAFELTPAGLRLSRPADTEEERSSFGLLDILVLVGLLMLTGLLAFQLLGLRSESVDAPKVADAASPAADVAQAASIAVLPFADLSDTGDQAYFTDGLSEELLNVFAQIDGLQVASRTSAFSFKGQAKDVTEIALLLGVAHVLEGSVRKAGRKLRITAQLIRGSDGFHLWSQTYDRTLDDVFAIQDDISNQILSELRGRLPGLEATVTIPRVAVEAFDLYLRGREASATYSLSGLDTAAELYRRAIAIDPDYADAYASLASVELLNSSGPGAYGMRPAAEAVAIARPLLDKALALAPESPLVWRHIGTLHFFANEYEAAEQAFLRAVNLQPNSPLNNYAAMLYTLGKLNQSIVVLEQQRILNPRSEAIRYNLVDSYLSAGRAADAQREAESMQRTLPDVRGNFAAEVTMAAVRGAQGEAATAIALLSIALEEAPDVTAVAFRLAFQYMSLHAYEKAAEIDVPVLHSILSGITGDAPAALRSLQPTLPRLPAGLHEAAMMIAATDSKWSLITDTLAPNWPVKQGQEACEDFEFPHALVAIALRELRRPEQLQSLLDCWATLLSVQEANGFGDAEFYFDQALLLALGGRMEAALGRLEQGRAETVFVRADFPFLMRLSGMAEQSRGRAILDEYFARVDRERAKLDLPPVVQDSLFPKSSPPQATLAPPI
jgi:TolB-like protein/Tfp pilus assembly protein PilF